LLFSLYHLKNKMDLDRKVNIASVKKLPLHVAKKSVATLPPILARLPPEIRKPLKRLNVVGDGFCGYYVAGLVAWYCTGEVYDPNALYNTYVLPTVRRLAQQSQDIQDRLFLFEPNHYLDSIEMGIIGHELGVNVILLTKIKDMSSGRGKRKGIKYKYVAEIPAYRQHYTKWMIAFHKDLVHYELITHGTQAKARFLFDDDYIRSLLHALNTDYPQQEVYENEWIFSLLVMDVQLLYGGISEEDEEYEETKKSGESQTSLPPKKKPSKKKPSKKKPPKKKPPKKKPPKKKPPKKDPPLKVIDLISSSDDEEEYEDESSITELDH
jgi:hypothetical protein